jgi:hypothetical protein
MYWSGMKIHSRKALLLETSVFRKENSIEPAYRTAEPSRAIEL